MSFETLTQEVSAWPESEIRKLQAYLVSLNHQRTPGTMEQLSAKLDDPDPSRWVSLEDAAKRLGLDS
jgi:hypothetical protein